MCRARACRSQSHRVGNRWRWRTWMGALRGCRRDPRADRVDRPGLPMVKAPTDLRALRSRLRQAEQELAAVEAVFDELGIDTHTGGGGRYRTQGRARRLATEVRRLRRIEHGDE